MYYDCKRGWTQSVHLARPLWGWLWKQWNYERIAMTVDTDINKDFSRSDWDNETWEWEWQWEKLHWLYNGYLEPNQSYRHRKWE